MDVTFKCYPRSITDIQLEVEGMKSLRDSLCEYVAVDNLDEDNKYLAGNYGLQVAVEGAIFSFLPPVLHIQLKRFKYDDVQDCMVKVSIFMSLSHPVVFHILHYQVKTRHEYPADIDLEEFLDNAADRSNSWVYKLHGVIVHQGNPSGAGGCKTFFKPSRDSRWLKFDDNLVTFATDIEVFDRNYGGEDSGPYGTHANILIYIREMAVDRVLAPVTEFDVPLFLSPYFIPLLS
jgi:ubiquitin carboxyl-terminal hydrolase 7